MRVVMRRGFVGVLFALLLVSWAGAELIVADADGYADGVDISDSFEGVTLSSVGPYSSETLDGRVYARTAQDPAFASTGVMIFGNNLTGTDSASTPREQLWYETAGGSNGYHLRADFAAPADYVGLDFITNNGSDYGELRAYAFDGSLLATVSAFSTSGVPDTAEISRSEYDIAYIVASGVGGETLCLDNLRANIIPEPATLLLLGLGGLVLRRRRR